MKIFALCKENISTKYDDDFESLSDSDSSSEVSEEVSRECTCMRSCYDKQ